MNGVPLLLLLIYSGFTINLVLQCGLGLKGIVEPKEPLDLSYLIKLVILSVSIVLLWFFFCGFLHSLISGIFIYVILFPVCAIVYNGFEYLIFNYILKKELKSDSSINFYGGITAVAVFICINLVNNFIEVIILSFGFTAGIFLLNLIVTEVRKRASLEAVPVFLRGKPLILITMGLLSLVFTTASFLFFRMIGTG